MLYVLSSSFVAFASKVIILRNTQYDIACNKVIHIEENLLAYYWFYYNRIGLHEQFSFLIEISIFYYFLSNLKFFVTIIRIPQSLSWINLLLIKYTVSKILLFHWELCSIKIVHQHNVITHSPHLIANVLFVFWVVVFNWYECRYWRKCLSSLKIYERHIHEADVTKFVLRYLLCYLLIAIINFLRCNMVGSNEWFVLIQVLFHAI